MQKIQRIENSVNCVKDNVNLLDQGGQHHLGESTNYVISKRNHPSHHQPCKQAQHRTAQHPQCLARLHG